MISAGTSLLHIKDAMPEVFVDGGIEAKSKGGKIGPAAAGEPVDTEGREAEGKPVLLEEGPLIATGVTVGNVGEELAGAEKFTDFWR